MCSGEGKRENGSKNRKTMRSLSNSRSTGLTGGIAFVPVYVLLDWASYLHALYGLNITPWNPSLALGLVCYLRYGRLIAIPWFVALLLGEIMVRGLPAPILTTAVISGCMVVGYGTIAEALRRYLSTGDVLT